MSAEESQRFDACRPVVRAIARKLSRELRAELDDLEQDGWLGLLVKWSRFDATRGVPFHRWAAMVAERAMRDGLRSSGDWRYRRCRRATRPYIESLPYDSERVFIAMDRGSELDAAIDVERLLSRSVRAWPRRQRQAIEGSLLEESARETASRCGSTEGTIHGALRAARQRLRESITQPREGSQCVERQ